MVIPEKISKQLGSLKRNLVGRVKNHLAKIRISGGVQKTTLAKTVNHAHIDQFRLGNGPKKILFLAGIHGNEVGTVKLCCQLLNHLTRHKKNYKEFSFFFIPCLNPDGMLEAQKNPDYKNGGRVGRLNAHHVDLNRNFPTKNFRIYSVWGHGKNYAEKTKVYCGRKGACERETKALVQLIHEEKIPLIFSFHNVAGDLCSARDPLSTQLAADYSTQTGFKNMPHEEWLKLEQTGSLKDWCDENHIGLLEIEGSVKATRWGSDWGVQKKALLAALAKLQSTDYNAAI